MRKQPVVLRGISSNWQPFTSGVRQDLVLGPLLFLIYTNDIYEEMEDQTTKFADDTKLYNRENYEKSLLGKIMKNTNISPGKTMKNTKISVHMGYDKS